MCTICVICVRYVCSLVERMALLWERQLVGGANQSVALDGRGSLRVSLQVCGAKGTRRDFLSATDPDYSHAHPWRTVPTPRIELGRVSG